MPQPDATPTVCPDPDAAFKQSGSSGDLDQFRPSPSGYRIQPTLTLFLLTTFDNAESGLALRHTWSTSRRCTYGFGGDVIRLRAANCSSIDFTISGSERLVMKPSTAAGSKVIGLHVSLEIREKHGATYLQNYWGIKPIFSRKLRSVFSHSLQSSVPCSSPRRSCWCMTSFTICSRLPFLPLVALPNILPSVISR